MRRRINKHLVRKIFLYRWETRARAIIYRYCIGIEILFSVNSPLRALYQTVRSGDTLARFSEGSFCVRKTRERENSPVNASYSRECDAYLPGLSEYPKQPRRFNGVLTFRQKVLISCLLLQRDAIAAKYRVVYKTIPVD